MGMKRYGSRIQAFQASNYEIFNDTGTYNKKKIITYRPHYYFLYKAAGNYFMWVPLVQLKHFQYDVTFPVWWPGNKNSPTVIHACRKRRLKWVANLPLGDINTEAWSSGIGVGRGANNPTL
jgi:hypothetical protein